MDDTASIADASAASDDDNGYDVSMQGLMASIAAGYPEFVIADMASKVNSKNSKSIIIIIIISSSNNLSMDSELVLSIHNLQYFQLVLARLEITTLKGRYRVEDVLTVLDIVLTQPGITRMDLDLDFVLDLGPGGGLDLDDDDGCEYYELMESVADRSHLSDLQELRLKLDGSFNHVEHEYFLLDLSFVFEAILRAVGRMPHLTKFAFHIKNVFFQSGPQGRDG